MTEKLLKVMSRKIQRHQNEDQINEKKDKKKRKKISILVLVWQDSNLSHEDICARLFVH